MRKEATALLSLALAGGTAWAQQPAPAVVPAPAASNSSVLAPAHPSLASATPAPSALPCHSCFIPAAAPEPRLWGSLDYLHWWVRRAPQGPFLITTSDTADLGILGGPSTVALFGGSSFDFQGLNGLRTTVGGWIDGCRSLGFEASGFVLERGASFYNNFSDVDGAPLLAFPIVAADPASAGNESSHLISSPGDFAGSVAIRADSRFWGAEFNGVANVLRDCGARVNLLAGFRHLNLSENLQIWSNSTILPTFQNQFFGFNGVVLDTPGDALEIHDRISTRNQFYGGQIGAQAEFDFGRLTIGFLGKIALGGSRQTIQITGDTTHFFPGGVLDGVAPGGLYAQATNSGVFQRTRFAYVPEIGINLGYRLTDAIALHAGYTFLYWNQVARPGDQIDRVIDRQLVPSSIFFNPAANPAPTRPAPLNNSTEFWAHGLNFGVGIRW